MLSLQAKYSSNSINYTDNSIEPCSNSLVCDCDEAVERSSLSSSQIEADNRIITEFEEICKVSINHNITSSSLLDPTSVALNFY